MYILFTIIGFLLLFFGILGAFIPFIPGPPVSFLGILLISYLHDFTFINFDNLFYFAVVAGLITFLDYWLQVYSVKIFGGGKFSLIGVIIGIPFVGAYLGALYESDFNLFSSFRIAFGALIGFMGGVVIKISYSIFALCTALSYLITV